LLGLPIYSFGKIGGHLLGRRSTTSLSTLYYNVKTHLLKKKRGSRTPEPTPPKHNQ
jgi:hypothetical protein